MRPRYKFGLCFGQPRTELLAENEAPQSINQRPIVSFFCSFFSYFFQKGWTDLLSYSIGGRTTSQRQKFTSWSNRGSFYFSIFSDWRQLCRWLGSDDDSKLKSRRDADCGRKDETQLSREHHLFKNIFELSDEMLKMFRNWNPVFVCQRRWLRIAERSGTELRGVSRLRLHEVLFNRLWAGNEMSIL